MKLAHKAGYFFRFKVLRRSAARLRNAWFSLLGMTIGKGTLLPKIYTTWPHQVQLGSRCRMEHNIYFKFDGIWQPGCAIRIHNRVFIGAECEFNIRYGIDIGDDSLIASGCRFIDHDHGTDTNQLMRLQPDVGSPIRIGKNAWLGCNVVVLKGVSIGDGAIIAAGAVVTKPVADNEIWGGVPARKIADRAGN